MAAPCPPQVLVRPSRAVGASAPAAAAALLSPDQVARAIEQEFEELDYICERRLQSLSGEENLERVHQLELAIDTREHTLSQLGHLCPNLKRLKLKPPSKLRSFRDLGTSLRHLRVLWASRCGVTDLDGISVLPGLEELYVSFNRIVDVTPLAMHEKLQVLDLEEIASPVRNRWTSFRRATHSHR